MALRNKVLAEFGGSGDISVSQGINQDPGRIANLTWTVGGTITFPSCTIQSVSFSTTQTVDGSATNIINIEMCIDGVWTSIYYHDGALAAGTRTYTTPQDKVTGLRHQGYGNAGDVNSGRIVSANYIALEEYFIGYGGVV